MRAVTLQDYKRRLLRVLVHIQDHLDEPLALEQLAAVACFSPYHFHRLFKGMVGESVKEYVRRLRLERAASRLKLGTTTVLAIALEAGYESHEAFTRSFRAAFGVSPSQFRVSNRASALDGSVSGVHYQESGKLRHFRTQHAGGKRMKVTIERREPVRVAFMRHVGPYNQVGATWDNLLPLLGKEGWLGGDVQFIGVCHDDPEVTPANRIRYDACVTVGPDFAPVGEIGVQTIAGGEYALTTRFGPYHRLGETYTWLVGQWLPRSGRALRATPCFEVYLNDPQTTDPEELLTDVYVPLD